MLGHDHERRIGSAWSSLAGRYVTMPRHRTPLESRVFQRNLLLSNLSTWSTPHAKRKEMTGFNAIMT